MVSFSLPAPARAELAVYSVSGQRVARLASGMHTAGRHSIRWDGRDAAGRQLASGVYLVRLHAGADTSTRKLLRVR